MTSTIEDDKTITMDRQGRVVLPKAIRDEAGIVPGTPLAIVVRDGRIEISAVYPDVRLVERDGWTVAERVTPGPVLTSDLVRQTLSDLRSGRVK
jgi:AbrB family looped-hinge helix DNA binding protein